MVPTDLYVYEHIYQRYQIFPNHTSLILPDTYINAQVSYAFENEKIHCGH